MTPNPIHKVLSTLHTHRVRFLLMGGQACVLYGAAEFSRDTDIVLRADSANLRRLARALKDLVAEPIAVPPVSLKYLRHGHAIHFRCHHPEATGIRLDVMSVLRGVPSFTTLWRRRTSVRIDRVTTYELMSLPDLVRAKKTQRDKDWQMMRRLVEVHVQQHRKRPAPEHILFWLRESRDADHLRSLARRYPRLAHRTAKRRPLLRSTATSSVPGLERALAEEEAAERAADRNYWLPLRRALERLRHRRANRTPKADAG